MLTRHVRAHNLNVSEMRLLFSMRCADPGIFVRGGEGGGPTAEKQPQQCFFLNPQLILQLYRGGGVQHFSEGSNFFQRGGGGGGPDAYFHKNAYNL